MTLAIKPRSSLEGQHFQVVVLGGGINGVAIARECARAGKRTLLVEQNDFASGVTSRSTRIIHGGLRYLEHGELDLVRESVRERERLLRERSHLVHPIHFLFLMNENSQRSAMKVRAGLWLYQRMAKKKSPDLSEMEMARVQRALDAGHQWLMLNFEDAQCEFPERLVAEWMLEAAAAGAVVRNHCEVLAVDIGQGRARGVLLRDRTTGKDQRVDASWVINCTGPWADRICQRSTVRTKKPMIGGVRGSHIVLPRFSGAPTAALYTEAADGRPVFVLPWNEQILVGSTEVPDSGDPGKTSASQQEIEYLLQTAAGLFPKAKLAAHDIKYAFAGIRPLPNSPGDKPSAVTRRHFLHDHRIRTGWYHAASENARRLTGADRNCKRPSGCDFTDHFQTDRGISNIRSTHRITVHRRVGPGRNAARRPDRLGKHATKRGDDVHALGGQRPRASEDLGLRLFDGQHGGTVLQAKAPARHACCGYLAFDAARDGAASGCD